MRFTPGDEGKWFAAAKDAGLYDEALALARSAPCEPKTLTRAARAFAVERPAFAVEAGLLALAWLAEGHGYDVTTADAWQACAETIRAAEQNGTVAQTTARIRAIASRDRSIGQIVQQAVGAGAVRA